MKLNLRFFSIALGVAVAHCLSGIILLCGVDAALAVTPLALLKSLPFNSTTIGVMLIIASISAVLAFWQAAKFSTRTMLAMIAPQQILLLFSLISVLMAIVLGHYPDGYEPSGGGLFIAADQIWLLTFCFWHTIEYGAIFSGDRFSHEGDK